MKWSHTIQITWIRCFSLYIYYTEILTELLPSANKAIGSGISSSYFLFVNIKTVRGCSPLTKIAVLNASKLKKKLCPNGCEAGNNIGELNFPHNHKPNQQTLKA